MPEILKLKIQGDKWNLILKSKRIWLKFYRAAIKALCIYILASASKNFFTKVELSHSEIVSNQHLKNNNKIKWNK